MTNMKHLINVECAKHDVPSVVVESLIARIIAARAVLHCYMRTKVYVGNIPILVGKHLAMHDADLFFAALDVGCNVTLTKEVVQNYVAQYIRVYKQ